MKVGFSGHDNTPGKFPSMWNYELFSVGRPKYNVVIPSTANQLETYIGEDLNENKRGLYKLKYPIKNGVVENWDDM